MLLAEWIESLEFWLPVEGRTFSYIFIVHNYIYLTKDSIVPFLQPKKLHFFIPDCVIVLFFELVVVNYPFANLINQVLFIHK